MAKDTSKPIAVPLRMLEVFTAMDIYVKASTAPRAIHVLQNITQHLISQGVYLISLQDQHGNFSRKLFLLNIND